MFSGTLADQIAQLCSI